MQERNREANTSGRGNSKRRSSVKCGWSRMSQASWKDCIYYFQIHLLKRKYSARL